MICKMKKQITGELLKTDYRGKLKIILFSFFVIAGIAAILCPLIYSETIKGCLLHMVFTSLLGIPFCVLGLKNIFETMKRISQFNNGEYVIAEDCVTHKQMLHKGASSDTSDSYCQLSFEKHSEKTGKAVVVKRKVYQETKKGDLFYMVYVDNKLIGYYPQKKYEYNGH